MWYLRTYIKSVEHLETGKKTLRYYSPMPLAFAFKFAARAAQLASNPLEAAVSLEIERNPMMTYEQWLAAVCLWREARGQSIAVKTAIWHVIQNRASDAKRRWPRTISGVVAQRMQFSSMTAPGDPNLVLWPTEPIPGANAGADWNAFLDCQTVVESPLAADPANGANMYESEPVDKRPKWSDPNEATLTLDLGNTRFYRLL